MSVDTALIWRIRLAKLPETTASPFTGREAKHVSYALLPSRYDTGDRDAARLSFGVRGKRVLIMLTNFEPFRIEHLGPVCVVRAVGDVDLANSDGLEKTICEASVAHNGPVIASFVDCTFADCSCLSVLIRAFKSLGARLHIVAPPKSSLRRVLDLSNMSCALPVHDEFISAMFLACVPREGTAGSINPPCA